MSMKARTLSILLIIDPANVIEWKNVVPDTWLENKKEYVIMYSKVNTKQWDDEEGYWLLESGAGLLIRESLLVVVILELGLTENRIPEDKQVF